MTEFHEQYDEEMNICLLESHLKMSKSHANVVSVDENVDCNVLLYARNFDTVIKFLLTYF